MTDNFKRHLLRLLLSAALPLATLAGVLLGLAGEPDPASAGTVPTSGGSGIDGVVAPAAPSPASTPSTATTLGTPTALEVGGLSSVSGGGVTLQSPRIAPLSGTVSFTGTVAQAKAGETVVIQRQSSLPGIWVPAATATVATGGGFAASWHTNHSGSLLVRAVLVSASTVRAAVLSARGVAVQAATPALTLTVYRAAVATIFGPGLFGRRTACGERLTRATLGVASRTMKCGSMVAIYYRGRQLVVPVIDRGPYSNLASWDLTLATATALGIGATSRIGTLSPPPAA